MIYQPAKTDMWEATINVIAMLVFYILFWVILIMVFQIVRTYTGFNPFEHGDCHLCL